MFFNVEKKKNGDVVGVYINFCKWGKVFLFVMREDVGIFLVY